MKVHRGFPISLAAILGSSILGCLDSGGLTLDSDRLRLAVRVVVDSATFRRQGDFTLDLVPSDRQGNTFLADEWDISTRLTTPGELSLAIVSSGIEPADTAAVACAMLIDDSGSMAFSDPDRRRASAASLFWNALLSARPGNIVALLDFGRGNTPPTPGFDRTNLLAGFTSDAGQLERALEQVHAVPGGTTPLYTSAQEVIDWMDSTTSGPLQRLLVVITDGEPSDPEVTDSFFAHAADHQVRIVAVGVGDAAEYNPPTTASRLVEELATRTGGIYAAAGSAAELQVILQTLSRSVSPARLLVHLHLDPLPPPGVKIGGTVTISEERGSATSPWSFIAR